MMIFLLTNSKIGLNLKILFENPELCRGIHGEVNCIIQAAIHGTSIKGETTLYTTTFPCMSCLKLIINAGIKKVVYKEGYNMENKVKEELLRE